MKSTGVPGARAWASSRCVASPTYPPRIDDEHPSGQVDPMQVECS